uniref:Uncharacterized protein n=1 Tax=Sphaerodactylus townsendi TaxID=933632 RepID=A0ACB8EWP4_9SAUR
MDPSAVGRPGPLCTENSFLHASSPVSFSLQNMEESRARLLHSITPSAAWLASLESPKLQSQAWSDCLSKPSAVSLLDLRSPSWVPEQQTANLGAAGVIGPMCKVGLWKAGHVPIETSEDGDIAEEMVIPGGDSEQSRPTASLLTAETEKSPLYSTSSKLNPLWLENPFLKETASTFLTLRGLEESRARLLRPVVSSAAQWSLVKPSDAQFPLGPLETRGTTMSEDYRTQNEAVMPCCALEQLQTTVRTALGWQL